MTRRVLLGVGGGIAAYKSAELVRRLGELGCEVRCALTRAAESFVEPLTLEVLSGHRVYGQEYLSATGTGDEAHIEAARWADVVCIAPTTAHLLARLALGLADDFLTTTVLASQAPLVLAPAMHSAMWRHPAVSEHVATLEARGVERVGPEVGPLASGEEGIGRMASPETIAAAVLGRLGPRDLDGLRVLISAGPTYEPIDAVRFLGNRSSGRMGFALAAAAARRGATVDLVAGPVELATPHGVTRHDVVDARSMREVVDDRAVAADLVVMTAAVADFRPRRRRAGKIKKASAPLSLELTENPDILAGLAGRTEALVVGFAAETEPTVDEARAKLARKGADLLVVNDVSRADIGFAAVDNEVTVYAADGATTSFSKRPKQALANDLLDLFAEALRARETTAEAAG